MREIKFRSWDKERKEMLSPEMIIHLEGNMTRSLQEQSPFLIIMQYTGLKDKNGVEIYEGDIVKVNVDDNEYKIHKIIFDNNYCRFMFIPESYFLIQKHHSSHYEVIGNIYENPELLNR